MAAMSDYLEVQLRKHIFRTGSFTKPTALYIALFTAAPSDSGGGTEVTGGAYARINVAPLDANWSGASATDGLTDNVAEIAFAVATANWGTITHMAIFDAVTAGNMLFHGALTASKVINTNDQFKFAIGDLDVTLA